MKLKYKSWRLIGPRGNDLDARSSFPFDMLRYDPAYIHDKDLAVLLTQYENHGIRPQDPERPDYFDLIYTAIPGYLSGVMVPTIGRWASFGWSNFIGLDPIKIEDARHWNTVIGFTPSMSPIFLTLQDWLDCKNMDKWAELVRRTKDHYRSHPGSVKA